MTEIHKEALEAHKYAVFGSEIGLADPWRLYNAKFPQYNPSEFITNKGYRTVDMMRRDDQIKIAMRFKKHAILSTGWQLEPPEGYNSEWEILKFVDSCLKEIPDSFENKIEEILSAFDYGFSISEKVYYQGEDSKIKIKKIAVRRPHEIRFYQDVHGNIVKVIQETPEGEIELPLDRLIIYSYQPEFGNVYGKSDFEAAYRPWWHKENAYRWLGMYLERLGIPPIFALYNPSPYGTAELELLKTTMSRIQAGTTGLIPRNRPEDLEMWSPQLATGVSQVFLPALDLFDQHISRSILMPSQLGLSPEESVGSQARATVIFDLFMYLINSLRKTVEETIVQEQIIKPLVDLNFNTEDYPLFSFVPIKEQATAELFKTWLELAKVGVVTASDADEDHIREAFDFPEYQGQKRELNLPIPGMGMGMGLDGKPTKPGGEDQKKKDKLEQLAQEDDPLTPLSDAFYTDLVEAATQWMDGMVGAVKMTPGLSPVGVDGVALDEQERAIYRAYHNGLERAALAGQKEVDDIVRSLEQEHQFGLFDRTTQWVADWISSRALTYAKNIINGLRQVTRESLLAGIMAGETFDQRAIRLIKDYAGYWKGKPGLEMARARTIAVTESTSAFSYGKMEQAMKPEYRGLVLGFRYNSVLDNVTTEICTHLYNKNIKIDDPDLARLKPANHFNCRSNLSFITVASPPKDEEWITEAEKARAFALGQEGFM